FDEAVPKLLLAIQDDPSSPPRYRFLAACLAHMGRMDDAREIVQRLRAITPVVIPDAGYLRARSSRNCISQACGWLREGRHKPDPLSRRASPVGLNRTY